MMYDIDNLTIRIAEDRNLISLIDRVVYNQTVT